jgi:hypothetical protein
LPAISTFGMVIQIYEVSTPAEARALGAAAGDHTRLLVGDGTFTREQKIDRSDGIHRKALQKVPVFLKEARRLNSAPQSYSMS